MTAKNLYDTAYALLVPDESDRRLLGHENRYATALIYVNRALCEAGLPAVQILTEELSYPAAQLDLLADLLCAQLAMRMGDTQAAERHAARARRSRRRLYAGVSTRRDVLPGRRDRA